jgi:hypothetical protein
MVFQILALKKVNGIQIVILKSNERIYETQFDVTHNYPMCDPREHCMLTRVKQQQKSGY